MVRFETQLHYVIQLGCRSRVTAQIEETGPDSPGFMVKPFWPITLAILSPLIHPSPSSSAFSVI